MNKNQNPSNHAKYIKSIVYGGIDGTITTFAVVAGGAGAELSVGILLILGAANLLADGISMAFGDFISSRAEHEYQQTERLRELQGFAENQAASVGALKELFLNKGFDDTDSSVLSMLIAKNKHFLVDVLLAERNITEPGRESLITRSFYTFFSFVIFGAFPLLTYTVAPSVPSIQPYQFYLACAFTAVTLFCLGAMKVYFTGKNWIYSGLEMLLLGGFSASVAYLVGNALSWLAKT